MAPHTASLSAVLLGLLLLVSEASAQFFGRTFGSGRGMRGERVRRRRFFGRRRMDGMQPSSVTIAGIGPSELEREAFFIRTCDCSKPGDPQDLEDIRMVSDMQVADGEANNTFGLTNMIWGVGQFLDHDMALTIETEGEETFDVGTVDMGVMSLHLAETDVFRRRGMRCVNSQNAQTALVDASQVYGTSKKFLNDVLREPKSCYLRTTDGTFPPLSTVADEAGNFFFVTGDFRVSEHAFLAVQHTIWIREHNRICDVLEDQMGVTGQKAFNQAQAVVKAKWQKVVLDEFLPALGITKMELRMHARGLNKKDDMPEVSMEFSIGYRVGHDLIGDVVGDVNITDTFNSEAFFTEDGVNLKETAEDDFSRIVLGLATTPCKEFDGQMSDALRNNLFGAVAREDLAGRNIFRGRELGVPNYMGLAECFNQNPDPTTAAVFPDAWVGLLKEPKQEGSPFGPTLRAMLVDQFARSIFGRRGWFWMRDMDMLGDFVEEVQASTFARVITANTDVRVSGNVFKHGEGMASAVPSMLMMLDAAPEP